MKIEFENSIRRFLTCLTILWTLDITGVSSGNGDFERNITQKNSGKHILSLIVLIKIY